MTASPPTSVAPTPPAEVAPEPALGGRYRYLDVLRGVAMLGILLVNIAIFAEPLLTQEAPLAFDFAPTHDMLAAHGVLFFAQYKFITLFSLLFGVGMGVLRERAEASGRSYTRWMLRRLAVLLGIGVLHAWFVWYGDILTYYALLGAILFWASSLRPKTLTVLGSVLLALPLLELLPFMVLALVIPDIDFEGPPLTDEESLEVARIAVTGTWSEFFEALVEVPPAFETAVYREGGFLRATIVRSYSWLLGLLFFGSYFMPRIAGLFLLGMAATKARWFLSPEHNRGAFRRMLWIGLGVGLPLQAAGNLLVGDWAHAVLPLAGELCSYLGSLGIAAGYAGVVGCLCAGSEERPGPPRWMSPIEAVGRTALSNYLLQSTLCTLFFYAQPGLGFFGEVGRAGQLVVVLAVWAVGLTLSPLWLRVFPIGPVEWLWRRLTYSGARPALESAPSEAPR